MNAVDEKKYENGFGKCDVRCIDVIRTLPFSLGSDGHSVLVCMVTKRFTAEWVAFKFIEKCGIVVLERLVLLLQVFCQTLKLCEVFECHLHCRP